MIVGDLQHSVLISQWKIVINGKQGAMIAQDIGFILTPLWIEPIKCGN